MKELKEYSFEELKQHEFFNDFLNSETATSCFYMSEYTIYRRNDGEYYCNLLPWEDREYFYLGDVEPIDGLSNMSPDWEDNVKFMEELDDRFKSKGMNVITVTSEGKASVFIIFIEQLELFLKLDYITMELFNDDYLEQLKEMEIDKNTFANPAFIEITEQQKLIRK